MTFPARRAMLAFGALSVAASLAGVVALTARLDRVESDRKMDRVAPSAWAVGAPGRRTLPLGAFTVPADGVLRVSLCATTHDPHAVLDVVRPHGRTASVELESESHHSGKCYEARWRTRARERVTAALSVGGASPPPAADRVDVHAGGTIRPWMAWPMALLVLGLLAMVFAPRGHGPHAEMMPRTETVEGDDGAYEVLRAPSPWTSFTLLVVANVVPQAIWWAWAMTSSHAGETAVVGLAALVTQHVLMVLCASALLGAWRGDVRGALGLVPVGREATKLAFGTALLLLAVAVVTSLALKDVGDSPMGRAVEVVPTRYVIAYGALLAPLPEELFFRGVLLAAFGRRSLAAGVVVSAGIFTGMHYMQLENAALGLVPIGLLGVVNGYLRVRTRGLTVPWLVHTVYNGALTSSILLVT